MDEEIQQLQTDYDTFLQSLDTKTKALILLLLLYIRENKLTQGNYTNDKRYALQRAMRDFQRDYTNLITTSSNTAIRFAKNIKKAQLSPYISDAVENLTQKDLGVVKLSAIMHLLEYARISPVFNGSKDTDMINKIWWKRWSDGLYVGDRINRITAITGNYIESTIKQGMALNSPHEEIEKSITDHFVNSAEQKAMLRLAMHTVNMVHAATSAEIAKDAPMVKGIRIMRGIDGSPKCEICHSHAGPVGGDGIVYLKSEYGNLDIMVEQPPYHNYCKCQEFPIFKDVSEFINEY